MEQLGITTAPVVVYDTLGLFSAARCWWTLKAFSHPEVYVLDGGLPRWKREGYDVETEDATSCTPKNQRIGDPFVPLLQKELVYQFEQVCAPRVQPALSNKNHTNRCWTLRTEAQPVHAM